MTNLNIDTFNLSLENYVRHIETLIVIIFLIFLVKCLWSNSLFDWLILYFANFASSLLNTRKYLGQHNHPFWNKALRRKLAE